MKLFVKLLLIISVLIALSSLAVLIVVLGESETKKQLDSLFQLNGDSMSDLTCKRLEKSSGGRFRSCGRTCCSGWTWGSPDRAIETLRLKPHQKSGFDHFLGDLAECLLENNLAIQQKDEVVWENGALLIGDEDELALRPGIKHYSSQIRQLGHVFLDQERIEGKDTKEVKNKFTMYFDGCQ